MFLFLKISTEPILPVEVKQTAVEEISEFSSTYEKPVKNLLRGERLRKELTSRRESYINNAKAANAC